LLKLKGLNLAYSEYIIDTETTGTDPSKHDIIEICLWRRGEEESKTWLLKAMNPSTIEDVALRINKHKKEDILHKTAEGRANYKLPSDVIPEIEMWLMEDGAAAEDRVFIGQNPMFDYNFMLALWEKQKCIDTFPFGYWLENSDGTKKNIGMVIDTIDLVKIIDVCLGKRRGRYNLGSLVKAFGITKAQAHRADGDVKMTKELFEKIIGPMKLIIEQNFGECY
jgi:DNA polymerase III epsilon subunit-like protein